MANPESNSNNTHGAGVQSPFAPVFDFLDALAAGHGPRRGGGNPGFGPRTGYPFNGEAFDPFGGWGGPPRRGRHDHDSDQGENPERHDGAGEGASPATMRESPYNPPASHSTPDMPHPPQHSHGPPPYHHLPFGGAHRRGRGRGNGGRCGRGGPREYRGRCHGASLNELFESLVGMASTDLDFAEQARPAAQGGDVNEQHDKRDDNFAPPLDIFNTEKDYVLHFALPGAMKEDVGVHWDADKGLLNVAGVVYRPGNEEFLQSLTSTCERRVGMFERSIKLPPAGADDKDEVDAHNITAKMENGILIVTIPKAEKEWTEIHKIDVE